MTSPVHKTDFDPAALLTRFDPDHRRTEFFQLLEIENKHLNLVSRETSTEDWERMFAECLMPLSTLDAAADPCSLLDIGSGGGFPLVPLLVSGAFSHATALERTRKKAFALERILHEMNLPAEVIARDLSEASPDGLFDLVTLRYVSLDPLLWRQIVPLLSEQGVCLHYGEVENSTLPATIKTWSFQASDDQTVKHFSVVSPENR